jgi:hypothetical protein
VPIVTAGEPSEQAPCSTRNPRSSGLIVKLPEGANVIGPVKSFVSSGL